METALVGTPRVSRMQIRRPTSASPPAFPGSSGSPGLAGQLHPVLRRVYAARGITDDSELDLSLDRLLPIGSLEGLGEATGVLAAHRGGRVLVIGDFDDDGG